MAERHSIFESGRVLTMADGDEIHPNLPRRYLNTYRDLCVPAHGFDAADVAHDIARVVIADMRDIGGNPAIDFIVACGEMLADQLPEAPLLRQAVDYGAIHQQIDRLARQAMGNEQGMDLAKRAIRGGLEDYRQGGSSPNTESALENYMMKIHEARFSDCVPLTSEHLNGLSTTDVNNRLNDIRPFAQLEYAHLAKSIARNPDLGRRIQRRRFDGGLGLYDAVI